VINLLTLEQNVAIAISSDVYNKIDSVGTVGGIVGKCLLFVLSQNMYNYWSSLGAAVSGAFLFIMGLANSIILWRIIEKRQVNSFTFMFDSRLIPVVLQNLQDERRRAQQLSNDETARGAGEEFDRNPNNHMLMMRILGPIITFVDRPWKVKV
jgi:high-affinity nickel-transport protein